MALGYWASGAHNGRVGFLVGEWVTSNLLFTASFLVAGMGILGIGAWVLRADRLNRAGMDDTVDDESHEAVP